MTLLIWIAILFGALYGIAKTRASFVLCCAVTAVALFILCGLDFLDGAYAFVAWSVFLLIAVPLNSVQIRQRFISAPLLQYIKSALPPMSETERTAIEAGTVWWEAELFQGNPDWQKLLQMPAPQFSPEEQAFIDGPVETLCAMLDDWQITHEFKDLPEPVWQFMKDNGFLG